MEVRAFGRSLRSWSLVLLLAAAGAPAAGAATIEAIATPFTGSPVEVKITFDDAAAGPGEIWIGLEVLGPVEGDIRGLFLNLADDSLLADLMVSGPDVSVVRFGETTDLGRGANLQGGGSPCPCDLGIGIGSPGIGEDDVQSTWVVLSHPDLGLDLSLFQQELAGVRLTSVGLPGHRYGSSKTLALVPEPTTGGLLCLGLLVLAGGRRCRRSPDRTLH